VIRGVVHVSGEPQLRLFPLALDLGAKSGFDFDKLT